MLGRVKILPVIAFAGVVFLSAGAWLLYAERQVEDLPVNPNRLNVVLIVMDAFRADRPGTSRNGVPLTPFLDSLASRAVIFENAITPCTWTRPAMASVFTSLYVDTHQVYYGASMIDASDDSEKARANRLADDSPTMASILSTAGYRTIGIQANAVLAPKFGFGQGFDVYVTVPDLESVDVTDLAISKLGDDTSLFFLYVHYMAPHAPYMPPTRYQEMLGFPPEGLGDAEKSIVTDFMDYLYQHCRVMTGRSAALPYPPLSETGQEALRMLYDGEVRYTDDEVRRLVGYIQTNWPDTLFIITADHGEHLWDHGYLSHGLTMFDCELRVPLYLFAPGMTPQPVNRPVEILDILPTIAELVHIPACDTWQGRSLLEVREPAPVFSYSRAIAPVWNTECEMVICDGWKFIYDRQRGNEMLFHWFTAPYEKNNLVELERDKASMLRCMLDDHRKENIRARRATQQHAVLDEEAMEQLRRLGYLD